MIISGDVTFDETRMGMKCKNLEVKESETMVEEIQFEVLSSETRDEELFETRVSGIIEGQLTMSPNYQLTRNRVRSEIAPPQMYGYVDLICYALNMDEGLQNLESKTFKERIKNKDSQR